MSIPDNLIFFYYKALVDTNNDDLLEINDLIKNNPYKLKKELAFLITFYLY
jgi:hypothetical protein